MKFSRIIIAIFTMASLAGCVSFEPKYEIQQADNQFIEKIRGSSNFSIISNDVATPSEKINQAAVFGVVGVLLADASTKNILEDAGINLYKSLPGMLESSLEGKSLHYIPNKARVEIDNQTLSKRIKKNRMWGTREPESGQITSAMKKLSDVEYGLYVRTWIADFPKKTQNDTTWIFYNKAGVLQAKIRTKSFADRPKEDNATKALERYRLLQQENVNKFIDLLANGSAVAAN